MLGLSLQVANYEIDQDSNFTLLDPIKYKGDAMLEPRNQKTTTNMLRLIIMITSLLAIVCLTTRHYYKMIWMNNYLDENDENHIYYQYNEVIIGSTSESIKPKKKLINKTFIFEVILLLIFPIPYHDWYISIDAKETVVTYLYSELILAVMWLRIYFLLRSIFNYSIYTDAYSKKLCKSYGFSAGVRFTFKCQMIINPEWTVFIMFMATVLILGYLMRIFEIPYYR